MLSSLSTLVFLGCPSPQICHTHTYTYTLIMAYPLYDVLETARESRENQCLPISRLNARLDPEHPQGRWPGLLLRAEDGGDIAHSGADSPARSSHSLAPKSPCLLVLFPLPV